MNERADLIPVARQGLIVLLASCEALRLDLLRTVQACEAATGREHILLERGEQDIAGLAAALRRTLAVLDTMRLIQRDEGKTHGEKIMDDFAKLTHDYNVGLGAKP